MKSGRMRKKEKDNMTENRIIKRGEGKEKAT
jgi:hypothetical protein